MKIRIEGTKKEIQDFLAQSRGGQLDVQMTLKSISEFYPNRVNSNELMNGLVDTKNPMGRVYVELE